MRAIGKAGLIAAAVAGVIAVPSLVIRATGAESPPSPAVSPWHVRDNVSEVDGHRTYLAGRWSGYEVLTGNRLERAMLSVACAGRFVRVAVSWPTFLGSDDSVSVTYSVDRGETQTSLWLLSDDGRALMTDGYAQWRDLKDAALGGKQLAMRVRSRLGAQEAVFPIDGIGEQIRRAEAVCGANV